MLLLKNEELGVSRILFTVSSVFIICISLSLGNFTSPMYGIFLCSVAVGNAPAASGNFPIKTLFSLKVKQKISWNYLYNTTLSLFIYLSLPLPPSSTTCKSSLGIAFLTASLEQS